MAYVRVPGQRARHAHVCTSCGNIWKHQAPTPMTSEMNDAIHKCGECGAMRYEIDYWCPQIFGIDKDALAVLSIALVIIYMARLYVRHQ